MYILASPDVTYKDLNVSSHVRCEDGTVQGITVGEETEA
jgi:hypothetical protein